MDAVLKLSLFLLLSLSSILSAPITSSTAVISFTYTYPHASPPSSSTGGNSSLQTPLPQRPHPEAIAAAISDLRFGDVLLPHPDPILIGAFAFTNSSLLLSIPNGLIAPLASNRTLAVQWLHIHVLPFYPRSKIAIISAAADSRLSLLLPAIRKVHHALRDVGIRSISVSTSCSLINNVTSAFPPWAATFQKAIGEAVIRPLPQFLEDTDSSFLVNLYPYNMYRLHFQIPLGSALFHEGDFNFRDHFFAPGVRYRNLFDMMVDAVVTSLAVAGHENIPLVVTETGWPSSAVDSTADSDANPAHADLYLKSSAANLISGQGTPPRKAGVAQACIYKQVEADQKQQGEHNWGVPVALKEHLQSSQASKNIPVALRNYAKGFLAVVLVTWVFFVHTPEAELPAKILVSTIFAVLGYGASIFRWIRVENSGRRLLYCFALLLLDVLVLFSVHYLPIQILFTAVIALIAGAVWLFGSGGKCENRRFLYFTIFGLLTVAVSILALSVFVNLLPIVLWSLFFK